MAGDIFFFELVNDTLANVYRYSTGHGVTEEGGWDYALRIASDAGYGAIPMCADAAIHLLARPERGLLVLRRGQSKQITNFLAPQSYRLADRAGDLFFSDKGP